MSRQPHSSLSNLYMTQGTPRDLTRRARVGAIRALFRQRGNEKQALPSGIQGTPVAKCSA
ncbi:hypothetical protein RE428_05130 [Marinobacter nanhaiticus D15-8W]|nr:hypothetical protein RE428_05130 [Marinobacter nanhaiticus D15-8W]